MAADFRTLVDSLLRNEVEFVIVGGIALVLRGSARTTQDLDICYARAAKNLQRLAAALEPFDPRLRGAPRELPFRLDAATLKSGLNFTLSTDAGDIDLLGEISGIGDHSEVLALSTRLELYGQMVAVLDLDGLEKAKRAAGRLKDLLDLAEIVELRKLRDSSS